MMFPSFSEFQCLVDAKSKKLVVCTELDHKEIRCGNVYYLQRTLVLDPKPGVRVWLTTLPRNRVVPYLLFGYIVTSTRNSVRTPSELLYRD